MQIEVGKDIDSSKSDTLFSKYIYEDKIYKQIVYVKKESDFKISYKIETENKLQSVKSILKGDAIRDIKAIPENDVDENGFPYYCYEYHSQRENCKINLRIENDKEGKLKIKQKQAYCDTIGKRIGLYSLKILLKRVNH